MVRESLQSKSTKCPWIKESIRIIRLTPAPPATALKILYVLIEKEGTGFLTRVQGHKLYCAIRLLEFLCPKDKNG